MFENAPFILSLVYKSIVVRKDLPQWEAADAEIKVPSVENTELEGSRFEAWGTSVYNRTYYAKCQEFHPC